MSYFEVEVYHVRPILRSPTTALVPAESCVWK